MFHKEMVCSRAMYQKSTKLRRLSACGTVLLLQTASASAFALGPPSGPEASHLRPQLAAQYGGKSVVCDELRQRRVVSQNQMNDRLRNFFLFDAAERGCIDMIKELIAEGASVNARDRFGNTALLRAARAGENEAVKLLLAQNSDVHHRNIAGSTALLRAVTMNRRRTARILLSAGADPNQPNRRSVSPLIAAAYNGNVRMTELLLKSGARPEPRDATGKGAMVYAAAKGYPKIVAMLLDAGLSVDERYENGLTALMWAAGHTNDVPVDEGLKTVTLLLERGATLKLTEDRGRSALMIAAERGHAEIVAALLKAGADRERKDAEGKTARDLAASGAVRTLLVAD